MCLLADREDGMRGTKRPVAVPCLTCPVADISNHKCNSTFRFPAASALFLMSEVVTRIFGVMWDAFLFCTCRTEISNGKEELNCLIYLDGRNTCFLRHSAIAVGCCHWPSWWCVFSYGRSSWIIRTVLSASLSYIPSFSCVGASFVVRYSKPVLPRAQLLGRKAVLVLFRLTAFSGWQYLYAAAWKQLADYQAPARSSSVPLIFHISAAPPRRLEPRNPQFQKLTMLEPTSLKWSNKDIQMHSY